MLNSINWLKPASVISKYKLECLLAIIMLGLVALAQQKFLGDFGNHYFGSLFMLDGTWGPWVFDPASFNLRIYELGQRNFYLHYTSVPPFSAMLYIPFAMLPVFKAKLLWNLLGIVFVLLIFVRLHVYFNIPKYVLFFAILALIIPIRNNFYDGQSYILLCYLLLEGFIQYLKGNTWLMALAWSVCIHLKVSPLIVVFFLLFNQSYKALLQLGVVLVLFVLVSMPWIGQNVWILFFTELLPRLAEGEINNPYALNYQSLQVLLKTTFISDSLFNPHAMFHSPWLYQKLLLLFKVALMILGVGFSFSNNSPQQKFTFWIIIMLLISGYGNSFSLIFLIFPLAFYYEKFNGLNTFQKSVIVVLFIMALIPYYWFQSLVLPLRFPRLYGLMGILIGMSYLSFVKFYKPLAIIGVLFIFIPLGKSSKPPQAYLLKGNAPLLIYDFSVVGNQMKLHVFDFNGPSSQFYPLPEQINKIEILADSMDSWKRVKRICVNDSEEYFLSDANRGLGFYTIQHRKIKNSQ